MRRPSRAVAAAAALVLVTCSSPGRSERPRPGAAAPAVLAELPVPRTEVAGAAWQGRIVVAGGLAADGSAAARVDLYDPAADRWEPGPPLPVPIHHSGMAVVGDRVYVAGGYANEQDRWVAQAGVVSLGPGESSWRSEPSLLVARGGLALVAAAGRLVAVGGTTTGVTRSTEVLVPGQPGGWRPGPDLSQERDHLAGASSGGRVYAIAGRVGGLDTNLPTVESWDPVAGGPWRPEVRLHEARGGTSAAAVAGTMCVAGGEEPAGTIASVECLTGEGWELAARLAVPRHGLAVAALGARLHVVGGGPRPGLSVSSAHESFEVG
jgi:hypothetical protein